MPFHFGNVHMEECPRLLVETEVAFETGTERGLGMGAIVPMWFLKRPGMSLQTGVDELVAAVEQAATLAEKLPGRESVFEFWSDLYARQAEWGQDTSTPSLLSQHGTSVAEQSLIDAHCSHSFPSPAALSCYCNTYVPRPGTSPQAIPRACPAGRGLSYHVRVFHDNRILVILWAAGFP